jgi:hypothetical protein
MTTIAYAYRIMSMTCTGFDMLLMSSCANHALSLIAIHAKDCLLSLDGLARLMIG